MSYRTRTKFFIGIGENRINDCINLWLYQVLSQLELILSFYGEYSSEVEFKLFGFHAGQSRLQLPLGSGTEKPRMTKRSFQLLAFV